MSRPGSPRRWARAAFAGASSLSLCLLTLCAVVSPVGAVPYPPAGPPGREFLSNLSAPSIAPGGTTTLRFTVTDAENFSITAVRLTFSLYAFNGFPGDDVSFVPVSNAPVLENGSGSGPVVNVSVGPLASRATYTGGVSVVSSSDTPAGTFAIRDALTFTSGATTYRLESRGWFSASAWANATTEPNGSGSLNLSRLNVSGVVPETAVFVTTSYWPTVLVGLAAAGVVLVGAGAWVYFRRSSKPVGPSNSGAG